MPTVRFRDPKEPLANLEEFIRQAEDSGLGLVSVTEGLAQGEPRNVATFEFEPDILPAVQLRKLAPDLSQEKQQEAIARLVADEFSIISFSTVFDSSKRVDVVACRKRVETPIVPGETTPDETPPKKVFNDAELRLHFGDLKEKPNPAKTGSVIVSSEWRRDNLTTIFVPELKGLDFDAPGPFDGKVTFHRKAAPHMLAAFAEISQKGFADRLLFWSGGFVPRHIGNKTRKRLSPHSWAIAFDINDAQNAFGERPAPIGKKGSVIELVPIFEKHGFFWGGNFTKTKDAMHFEFARPA
jgi:hypothetical protein